LHRRVLDSESIQKTCRESRILSFQDTGPQSLFMDAFWHGHACPFFKLPTTRPDFWRDKIAKNQGNDAKAIAALRTASWRVILYGMFFAGKGAAGAEAVCDAISDWLKGKETAFQAPGMFVDFDKPVATKGRKKE